jgi:hypothetical protein
LRDHVVAVERHDGPARTRLYVFAQPEAQPQQFFVKGALPSLRAAKHPLHVLFGEPDLLAQFNLLEEVVSAAAWLCGLWWSSKRTTRWRRLLPLRRGTRGPNA